MATRADFSALGTVTMTLHKLSAGSGYEYLTRQVAAMDSTEKGHATLADYYSAKGESPGVWMGSGLAGIDGIEAGDVVTADQMVQLLGNGLDPVSGERLGRPYRLYDNQLAEDFRAEVGLRTRSLSAGDELTPTASPDIRARARTEVAREFFVEEHGREPANPRELDAAVKRYSRPPRTAVAGFDLTFSPVKSVSTLWAVAPREVAVVIERAHQAAVSDALRFIEREALFTREGLDGARQVETRGLIAAAFTHRDSRAGDPDLHTHVAVANKVQTRGGNWLAIYGRVLYESAVAASETYNTALECHLSEALGVRFDERPSNDREKRPVREIIGVAPSLNQQWSKRRRDIDVRRRELAADFQQTHGRPPAPTEAIALAQQANLETRAAKHEPRSLAKQRATWRTEAADILGSQTAVDDMVTTALNPVVTDRAVVSTAWVPAIASRVVAELEAHRATWKPTHVRAEAQRQVRGTDIEARHLDAVVEWVIDDVLGRLSVDLTPDPDPITDPEKLRRADRSSVYRHAGRDLFTSQRILDAEQQITAAAGRGGGRTIAAEVVSTALLESAANGVTLNPGQAELVRNLASSGRRVQVAIAAAGSGKTTAMRTLANAWAVACGHVVGLAPSAAAASALQAEAGIASDTLAKLAHDLDTGHPSPLSLSMGPDTLVIIDEAGMADTLTLARVIVHALGTGASVRLIGDDRQLSSIGAGGVLRDIATSHGAVRLDELTRFTDPAEAAASLALRDGDPAALGYYFDQDRVHIGDTTSTTEAVFAAWSDDRAAGLDSLMLAPTRDLVSELNQRAQTARLNNAAPQDEVELADSNRASVGDTILTRRNDRRLAISPTDWVKNGDRWTITEVRNGAVTARHASSALHVTLPASYVSEHVELGYASTVHTAQGLTADTMHGIITGAESRQMLYTMMTRGRHANHVHMAVTGDGDLHQMLRPEARVPATATETLEAIIAHDGAAVSATTTARETASPAARLHDATTRYADAMLAAAEDLIGSDRVHQVAQRAETLLPGLTDVPGWASLSVRLLLIESSGTDAHETLTTAVTYRPLDDADDAALVLGWRLHTLAPTDGGPLPWLPAVPARLINDPTWGPYLAERAQRVSDLAKDVRESAEDGRLEWMAPIATLPSGLASDVAVWRAAHGIPDSDRRPTGPRQADFAAREHQQWLDQRVNQHLDQQGANWLQPLTEVVGRRDNHTPYLAERLADLVQQGHDVRRLLQTAIRQGPLPDDHATAALDSRITRLVTDEDRVNRKRNDGAAIRYTKPPRSEPGIGF